MAAAGCVEVEARASRRPARTRGSHGAGPFASPAKCYPSPLPPVSSRWRVARVPPGARFGSVAAGGSRRRERSTTGCARAAPLSPPLSLRAPPRPPGHRCARVRSGGGRGGRRRRRRRRATAASRANRGRDRRPRGPPPAPAPAAPRAAARSVAVADAGPCSPPPPPRSRADARVASPRRPARSPGASRRPLGWARPAT